MHDVGVGGVLGRDCVGRKVSFRTPKAAAEAHAKSLCARIEQQTEGTVFTVRVTAPQRFHFNDGAVHELVATGRPTTALQRDEMWIDLVARMKASVTSCDLNEPACADWALS